MSLFDFENTDRLKKELREVSLNISKSLDSELRTLKLKATKCAANCFQTKEFREALQCEKLCVNSVLHMKNYMEVKTKPIYSRLKKCVEMTEDAIEGDDEKMAELGGSFGCYEGLKEELTKVHGEIVVEFSYFE